MSMLTPTTSPLPVQSTWIVLAAKRTANGIMAIFRARAHRREVTELLHLDDRMLKDMGLVRSDVLAALSEPVGADPSVGLRQRSAERDTRQLANEIHARRVSEAWRPAVPIRAAA